MSAQHLCAIDWSVEFDPQARRGPEKKRDSYLKRAPNAVPPYAGRASPPLRETSRRLAGLRAYRHVRFRLRRRRVRKIGRVLRASNPIRFLDFRQRTEVSRRSAAGLQTEHIRSLRQA